MKKLSTMITLSPHAINRSTRCGAYEPCTTCHNDLDIASEGEVVVTESNYEHELDLEVKGRSEGHCRR
ncbi:hypothetical protein DEO72_LG10g2524 [Vigna unguiculata]|uniref:Uncharacterized protein n=1 Tax=Vigna unguiculata TaxID=3917 RepID=A0A4D6NEI4_VIGUN|nr:hypothetical protein DEO72_LG10g2524 [Vigna unguiculata]